MLLIPQQRLPAPIQEAPEPPTPTPTPKTGQTAAVKPKHAAQPKVANERSSQGKIQPTPQLATFDGTWTGILTNFHEAGNVPFTLIISGSGTSVTETTANWGTQIFHATHDGSTMRWTAGSHHLWTFTPNPDDKTARATCSHSGAFLVTPYNGVTIFRRVSP